MAQFVNARHNDLVAGAPFAFFDSGLQQANTIPPPTQPAYGIQHIAGEAPFVYTDGTPNFVPPPPRNTGYFTFPPQHDALPAAFTFVGRTPPFIQPPPRNLGYSAFGFAQDPGDYKPWSFTKSIVQQVLTTAPPRGNSVFVGADTRIGTEPAFSFLRANAGIPTPGTLSTPAFRANFVRAGGWWDILSDAPFFFAAGYATQPPRGPFGKAYGELHLSGDAAYSFTNNTPAIPLTLFIPGKALGTQQPFDAAAYTFARASIARNQAGPPGSNFARGIQQPFDAAPFSFADGLVSITVLKPGAPAIGLQQPADTAPYVFTRDGAPKVIIFRPTGRVLTTQLPADAAPFVHTNKFLPGASVILPMPPFIGKTFTNWLDTGEAPYSLDGNSPTVTPVPAGALLTQQAIYNLVNAGLEVFITYGYDPVLPPGYLIAQFPPAGTPLPPFSVVTLVDSRGPSPVPGGVGNVTVPFLNGMTAQDARDAIFAARLSLGFYSWTISAQTAGTVVAQNPIALSSVKPGTIVTLTLSLGIRLPLPPIISPP